MSALPIQSQKMKAPGTMAGGIAHDFTLEEQLRTLPRMLRAGGASQLSGRGTEGACLTVRRPRTAHVRQMNPLSQSSISKGPDVEIAAMEKKTTTMVVDDDRREAVAAPADRLVEVSPADAVSRRTGRWPGMAVEIVQANRRCRIDYRYYASAPMLVFHERGVRHDGCTVIEGLPSSTLQDCPRKLVLVPAGHRYHDWHEPRTLSRTIFFYFSPSQLALGPDLGLSHLSLAPQLFFEDGALTETAVKLATLIESGGSDQRRYLEALGVVLAHELVRINTGRHSAQGAINGGLAAWQGRKAIAYIEEHLAEPISLEVLAGLVGLSPGYFCAAFRRSFGMPPHRYQQNQRMERAKKLLAKRAASVTDVGLTVGYSGSSAFCTAFRSVAGLTPSAYRRSLT